MTDKKETHAEKAKRLGTRLIPARKSPIDEYLEEHGKLKGICGKCGKEIYGYTTPCGDINCPVD